MNSAFSFITAIDFLLKSFNNNNAFVVHNDLLPNYHNKAGVVGSTPTSTVNIILNQYIYTFQHSNSNVYVQQISLPVAYQY